MGTYRRRLRELSFDTHGVVTLQAARDVGVPAVEVRKLAHRGALERLGQGVYRMLEGPITNLSEFAEAVALGGPGAVLADDSVLAAHDLALVNPRAIAVATDRRVRAQIPPTVRMVRRHVPEGDRDLIDGIPAMTVDAALLACRGRVMTDRLRDAAHDDARRGLLPRNRLAAVLTALHEHGAH